MAQVGGFSSIDKALLQRAARHMEQTAQQLEQSHGWANARPEKLEYDRLLRDARDLRALAKRLGTIAAGECALTTPPAV